MAGDQPALTELAQAAAGAVEKVLSACVAAVRARADGATERRSAQRALHALAWLATYATAIRALAQHVDELNAAGGLREIEEHAIAIALAEYLAQVVGGIAMSQGEIVRPHDLGLATAMVAEAWADPRAGDMSGVDPRRARLVALMTEGGDAPIGARDLDETRTAIRTEMRRFSEREIAPQAQAWHLGNELIPLDIVARMSALGVFGLTIPQQHGGLGLGKQAMCVVGEELSRGYIGVGSL